MTDDNKALIKVLCAIKQAIIDIIPTAGGIGTCATPNIGDICLDGVHYAKLDELQDVLETISLQRYDFETACSSVDGRKIVVRFDKETGVSGLFEIDGITPVVSGTAVDCGTTTSLVTRVYVSKQTINYNDSVTNALTVPVGANHAEIQPQGGDVQFAFDATPSTHGIWLNNGGRLELESLSELNAFRFLGMTGNSGKLVVFYFTVGVNA